MTDASTHLPGAALCNRADREVVKLLVFAFTPPPHHGQSWMVLQLLEGLGGDHREGAAKKATAPYGIVCYHVNSRLTHHVSEIGAFGGGKALKVFKYIAEAIYCRFRYGVKNLYYVPAPPNLLMPLLRDWVILACCRPFFSSIIFYWHAAGLGQWTEEKAPRWQKFLTKWILGRADISLSPSTFNLQDAKVFQPEKARTIAYGIPDPTPDFDLAVRPSRSERRLKILEALADKQKECRIQVFFLALCAREKGLHEAVKGVVLANRKLEQAGSRTRFHLEVAGHFYGEQERAMFEDLVVETNSKDQVKYIGFVNAQQKAEAFKRADIFCFPTYYSAESFPVVVIESMSFGCPVVTTRWRAMPEFFEDNYPGLVEIKAPEEVANALFKVLERDYSDAFRAHFLANYTIETHLCKMAEAIREVAV